MVIQIDTSFSVHQVSQFMVFQGRITMPEGWLNSKANKAMALGPSF